MKGVVVNPNQSSMVIDGVVRPDDDLAAARRRLEAHLSNSPLAIIELDQQFRIIRCSEGAVQLFGWRPNEVLERAIFDLRWVHEEDFDEARRVMADMLANRSPSSHFVARSYGKDGAVRDYEWYNSAIYDAQGRLISILSQVLDISERKRTEESLRRQVEFTRYYLDTVQNVIVALDTEGRVTMINRQGREILGYAEGELLGWNWFETCLPQPEGLDRVYPVFREIMAGELVTTEYFDNPIRCRDGRLRLIAWHNTTLTDDDGAITGTLSSGEDITERKRAEEALRASEAGFRQLADAMPQLVWTADPDGTVDYYNSRAEEYAGLAHTLDGSWTWRAVLHPDDLGYTVEAWQRAVASGRIYDCEHRMRMADGSVRWHLSRALPVRNEEGGIVKWFGTATDIQEVKLAHEALREADRRKDEFLATLAHELRNPLAPIRNAVEIFKLKGSADPDLHAARDMIDRQVQHMVWLIDELLDVSRITRGKLKIRKERVDLAAVLDQALDVARPLVERTGQNLTVLLPPEPIYLDADPVRLAQVFSNLLDNACKYTGKGGAIRLSAERDEADVVVRVIDNGIGIAPENLPRVFDMFSQIQSTSEQSQSGLGIGLSLASGLVRDARRANRGPERRTGQGQRVCRAASRPRRPPRGTGTTRRGSRGTADARSGTHPGGGRQRRQRRVSRHAAGSQRLRGGEGARWSGGGRGGGAFPPAPGAAGHRHAQARRLRCLPTYPQAALGREHAHRCPHRLGTG